MTETPPPPAPASRRKLLIGSGIAVVAAAAIMVLFVLPAEYDIDPTGFGKATGLTKIADPGMSPEQKRGALRSGVLTVSEGELAAEPGRKDHWEFELAPYTSIEFKYELPQGQAMTFHWKATGPVHYDMHAHPFEGGTALTESYSVSDATQMQGRYVAAFTGIHGWYWQNRSFNRVKLTLDASGGITGSRIFDSYGEHKRPLVTDR
jgi:hypothetical protein